MKTLRFAIIIPSLFLISLSLFSKDVDDIVAETSPAIVMIHTYYDDEPIGSGSGFIVDPKGVVVTNYHVIDGSDKAEVSLPDGTGFTVAGVYGYDPIQDIAVLKIEGEDLPFLKIGDSDKVALGSELVAIGHPDGLEETVSEGVLVTRRDLGIEGKYLQITNPLAPGFSGSPLMDMKGRVIGIITAMDRSNRHRGLAVPINEVIPWLKYKKLRKLGDVRAYQQRYGW